ncbi:sensor histidine kinase [Auraticoccus monumenti]|uniref:histidine kinase n=1 Tax=Auraticoccus monumenti TaxID=675864 RepID=A0A1G7BBC2_9ACTN|nr:histidine kinase [Auraticoccus monumenti]SDE24414.1 Signal transduction histidine kinase [Auraticoccus monumenti]
MPAPPASFQPRLTVWSHTWRTALCLVLAAVALLAPAEGETLRWGLVAGPALVAELVLGTVSFVAMFYRRRWPATVALLCALCSAGSLAAAGPAALTLVSLATWRRFVPLALVALVGALATVTSSSLSESEPPVNGWIGLGSSLLLSAVLAGWGAYLGSRRELLGTLRERAERAEREQTLREDQARDHERARIAREMHDVVAHRISQVSMRAGALAYRQDLAGEQVREEVGLIQRSANEALQELRGVLGVLRDVDGSPVDAPQPTLTDLPALVQGARAEGTAVRLSTDLVQDVPDPLARTVYRVVQEGLTNAGKHAQGAQVEVALTGRAGKDLQVRVANRAPVSRRPPAPGAGLGLVGMRERVELLGGRLDHGPDAEGGFALEARLPWPS